MSEPRFESEDLERMLAEGGQGTRFGLVVATIEGEELLAIAPDQRFIPASCLEWLT